MNRRRWFIWRRTAAYFWAALAVIVAIDFFPKLHAQTAGEEVPISAKLRAQTAGEEVPISAKLRAQTAGAENPISAAPAGNREDPAVVALTFDDGPHEVYTPMLLDGLRQRGVHASFFLIGQSIDGNEDIVRQMQRDGHLIGNHSQSHMQLTAENVQAACRQIEYTNEKIAAITGTAPAYIRPPYGSWSEELESLVPMTAVLWNLDPLDWKSRDRESIVRYVEKHAENGSIILLHDIYEPSVEAALQIVDELSENGYEFVTVDEMLIE